MEMSRRAFMDRLGAKQRNQVWAWSAVDHARKIVYLSLWGDSRTDGNGTPVSKSGTRSGYLIHHTDPEKQTGRWSMGSDDRAENLVFVFKRGYEPRGYVIWPEDPDAVPRSIKEMEQRYILRLELRYRDDGMVYGMPITHIALWSMTETAIDPLPQTIANTGYQPISDPDPKPTAKPQPKAKTGPAPDDDFDEDDKVGPNGISAREMKILALKPERVIGEGDQSVYVYTTQGDQCMKRVKIGYSSGPARERIGKQFNASNSSGPIWLLHIKCDDGYALEQRIHQYLDEFDLRVREVLGGKEWFNASPRDVEDAYNEIRGTKTQ